MGSADGYVARHRRDPAGPSTSGVIARRTFLGAAVVLAGSAAAPERTDPHDGTSAAAQPRSVPVVATRRIATRTVPRVDTTRPESQFELTGHRGWHLTRRGEPDAVAGYTGRTDVLPGERVALHAAATSGLLDLEVLRLGWYAGAGARRVLTRTGVRVPTPRHPDVSDSNTVTAGWAPVLDLDTTGWAEGAYLLKLTAVDGQRYVPLVVRSAEAAGRLLLVHATATWQAYNAWGGYSLYGGPGGPDDYGNRAIVVSSLRPFDRNGASKLLEFEQSVLTLAEKLRLPIAHTTNAALDADPQLAADASAVISLGHDEYWTPGMRDGVTAARDRGVNLAFLGANACFRRIRFSRNADFVTCYKSDFLQDPMFDRDDRLVTNDFREPPAADPECSLIGTYYEGYPTRGDYRVLTPDSWLFAGTGATVDRRYRRLIGPEYDRVNPVVSLPRPLQVLAHSPIVCKGVRTYADSAYYTTDSGAGVFSSGTMAWCKAVLRNDRSIPMASSALATSVTANLLTAFSQGPAAERFPAVDNLDEVAPWVGDPLSAGHDLW